MPKITKEFIIFTLMKFRNLDLRFEKNKERLIDGLVKAIFVYDDYIKLILTFDDNPINIPTTEEIEYMANSSDIGYGLIMALAFHIASAICIPLRV